MPTRKTCGDVLPTHIGTCSESVSESSKQLSLLLSQHKGRILIYTGAGISTSAKIPDYRGTHGLYKKLTKRQILSSKIRLPEATTARPTFTHMAIRALVDNGYIRHVVSQNIDGLHVRSGLPLENLTEIHGNLFNEKCQSCHSVIYRDFDAAELTEKKNHFTGRVCPRCCDKETATKLRSSLFQLAQDSCTRKLPTIPSIAQLKKAAEVLSDSYAQEHGLAAPLLQDTLVHYKEFYSLENRDRVLKSLYGSCRFASIFPDNASQTVGCKNEKKDSPESLQASFCSTKSACAESNGNSAMTIRSYDDEPATLILTIGSSLKVMSNYQHFWPFHSGVPTSRKDLPPAKRARTDPEVAKDGIEDESYTCDYAIINFQKTPIDRYAVFVCRFNCDDILKATLDHLGVTIPSYDENTDPLRDLAVPLLKEECMTKNRQSIFDL
nr:NAD dependent deacetylase sirtuin 7 [Hymenolepis microstoma]